MKSLAVRVLVAALSVALAGPVAAQGKSTKAFKYKGGRVDVGMMYVYDRSDLAGTRSGEAIVYVPSRTKLEIVFMGPGTDLVRDLVAEMDWDTYSLRSFELYTERTGGVRTLSASGTATDEALSLTVQDPALAAGGTVPVTVSIRLPHVPTHIYPFGLLTLSHAMRHLAERGKEFQVGLLGEDPKGPAWLSALGTVTVSFVEEVDRDGIACNKYKLEGPAFGSEVGFLWIEKDKGYLQDVEVAVPPGLGWPDLKMTYKSSEKVSESSWESRRAEEIARFLK